MLKKILISVLSVLIFLILITGGFRYAVNICNDYLLPEDGSVTKEKLEAAKNRTVDYLFAVDSASAEPDSGVRRAGFVFFGRLWTAFRGSGILRRDRNAGRRKQILLRNIRQLRYAEGVRRIRHESRNVRNP